MHVRAGIDEHRPATDFDAPAVDAVVDAGSNQDRALNRARRYSARRVEGFERPPFGVHTVAATGRERTERSRNTRDHVGCTRKLTRKPIACRVVDEQTGRHNQTRRPVVSLSHRLSLPPEFRPRRAEIWFSHSCLTKREEHRAMATRELPIPTFLIIGAQKSATRWLRLNLGAHPDAFSVSREIEFFNSKRFAELGLDWYREQFAGWSGEPVVGEATPGYMFWRHRPQVMAQRIHDCVPDARLMAILRNPVDRAQSAVVHHVQMRSLPPGTEVMDYVPSVRAEDDPLGIVSGGWYAASLEPFREVFGDQLLVMLHDDVDDDPRGVYDQALRHVGLEPDFMPDELARVRFSFQERPSAMPSGARELTLDERRTLYELFADDIQRLEQVLDRDLTLWDPEQAMGELSSAAAGRAVRSPAS